MRPGVWYLILAVGYFAISIWSLYFVCTMFASVQDSICKSASFVDVVNAGRDTNTTWVGAQRLGKQIYIFSDEATQSQQYYNEFFSTYNPTINELSPEHKAISD